MQTGLGNNTSRGVCSATSRLPKEFKGLFPHICLSTRGERWLLNPVELHLPPPLSPLPFLFLSRFFHSFLFLSRCFHSYRSPSLTFLFLSLTFLSLFPFPSFLYFFLLSTFLCSLSLSLSSSFILLSPLLSCPFPFSPFVIFCSPLSYRFHSSPTSCLPHISPFPSFPFSVSLSLCLILSSPFSSLLVLHPLCSLFHLPHLRSFTYPFLLPSSISPFSFLLPPFPLSLDHYQAQMTPPLMKNNNKQTNKTRKLRPLQRPIGQPALLITTKRKVNLPLTYVAPPQRCHDLSCEVSHAFSLPPLLLLPPRHVPYKQDPAHTTQSHPSYYPKSSSLESRLRLLHPKPRLFPVPSLPASIP